MGVRFFSQKRIVSIFVSILSILGYSYFVFAQAPLGGYLPAQTLNPACAPGDTDCFVAPYFINTTGNTAWLGYNAGSGGGSTNYTVFLGTNAGNGATNASNSNFIGQNAGQNAVNANNSNFFGENAGCNATNADNANFFGKEAGCYATNANNSNFFGYRAGYTATNADHSTFFGDLAGNLASSAYSSSFIGASAGNGATNAYQSNFFGRDAGNGAVNASDSSFLGYRAGYGATDASSAFFAGNQAGYHAFGANTSVFIGNQAGYNASGTPDFLTSASNPYGLAGGSNFIGYQAGYGAEGAIQSTFMGTRAGYQANTALGSTIIGFMAGSNSVLSTWSKPNLMASVVIGANAGNGVEAVVNGVYMGNGALQNAAYISNSVAIGPNAVAKNARHIDGTVLLGPSVASDSNAITDSIIMGRGAANNADTLYNATIIGQNAGSGALSLFNAIAIGTYAGSNSANNRPAKITYTNLSGTFSPGDSVKGNTSNFYFDVYSNNGVDTLETADINPYLIVGETITDQDSGATAQIVAIDRGSTSIMIGAKTNNNSFVNSIALGTNAVNTSDNQFIVGSQISPINEVRIEQSGGTNCTITNSGLNCTSDQNLKTNISDLSSNILDPLSKVRTVTYNWKSQPTGKRMIGFLAQDLEQYFPELVTTDSTGQKSVNYANMTPVLVEAVKELNVKLANIQSVSTTVTTSFLESITNWLADKANGINKIFAHEVCLTDGSDEECITMQQLRQLKSGLPIQSVVQVPVVVDTSTSTTTTVTTTPSSEPTTTDVTSSSSTDGTITEVAPLADPVVVTPVVSESSSDASVSVTTTP